MTTYLITGVNRGIGAALMAGATARGHTVIGTTRDGRYGTVPLIFDDPARIAAQLADIPPVDVLINNAGVIGPEAEHQTPLDMDWYGFAHTLSVNTLAPLAEAQAVLPRLRESRAPRIVNVSSQMAWMRYRKPTQIAYRASKSTLNKVMQGLATSLEPDGILVVLVDPGWVRTDMGGMDADEDPDDVAAGFLDISAGLTLAETGKFFRFTGEEREF
ncbi:SDR family NAD(P)-dependent oxidoreductase [Sulfitobacter mediterraneus]|uniref:Short-subunit dehydrogenase n=1 Tax=Sulfitobacter mediterraneus TaxID=83219 RepID=A0A2T6CJW3_9RHOB|nr:SDR family NAD(P)-dependent oxidoreductase [Sulfitobacter mediterraneus]KIN78781.1 Oxidoreductase, short-chain dehydrogenase/reductase family protein [Sulfitobacter mediterraneus KCTC 32188]PTX75801.1 short-subunit dehydrogenase [Sulfitobacter mediterraneus]